MYDVSSVKSKPKCNTAICCSVAPSSVLRAKCNYLIVFLQYFTEILQYFKVYFASVMIIIIMIM